MTRIAQIFRYPVKGMSPQALSSVELAPGRCLPGDRQYALAHGTTQFNAADPQYLPPAKFLTLKRNEKLAALRTRFNEDSQELLIERNGKPVARGRLDPTVGREMLEQFFAAYLAGEVRGSPRIVRAPGHSFSDEPEQCLSLINISGVRELERVMGKSIDPLRFRGNVYFDTGAPWDEFDWRDREIVIDGSEGPVVLAGMARIQRCAATNVDPESGARDLNILPALERAFGHIDMGLYARVVSGGRVAVGDALSLR